MQAERSIGVLTIDAGGTFFKSALVSETGEILPGSFSQVPSHSHGSKARIIESYERLFNYSFAFAQKNNMDIIGIGISTPGPFDYEHGMSLMTHKFQTIKAINLKEEFHALSILDEKLPIVFLHDAHAFLLGEHWNGALKNIRDAVGITLGTGLGFGIIKNGQIVDNSSGGPCVSLFQQSYKGGILEDVVSRRGIIKHYCEYTNCEKIDLDVHNIAELARNNDMQAVKVFRETGKVLAVGLMPILNEYKINSVVFGGQISKAFDLFGPAFQDKMVAYEKHVHAIPAKNIELSLLTGAALKTFRTVKYDMISVSKTLCSYE